MEATIRIMERKVFSTTGLGSSILELYKGVEALTLERDYLARKVEFLEEQLQKAMEREERSEARLVKLLFAIGDKNVQRQEALMVSAVKEILIDGRKVLQLQNPVTPGKAVALEFGTHRDT
jgi:hypothetical protein